MIFTKPKIEFVEIEKIKEYPTRLGSKCLLLKKLGYDPYSDTEEEIMDVLIKTEKDKNYLNICKESSRCSAFYKEFSQGNIEPYFERDPIYLERFENNYWVIEGKHRICLAKRAGIKKIKAYIYETTNSQMLLPNIGQPEEFVLEYSKGIFTKFSGSKALLWIKGLKDPEYYTLIKGPIWLDKKFNTCGKIFELLPGVKMSINVQTEKSFIRKYIIQTRVIIENNHKKTKVWLLKIPCHKKINYFDIAEIESYTLYRYGLWREHDRKELILGFLENNLHFD
ncbi:hypothetical protein ACAG39_02105 [Caldicellulosiruptoraceae bacterium PP1]